MAVRTAGSDVTPSGRASDDAIQERRTRKRQRGSAVAIGTAAMGLCKCPKRRVTTLFCFEHRVNVCESCLVSAHPKCIVRSYLQWLQDSDYSPQCPLCHSPLGQRDTVRLPCYDVFHWPCLAAWARALPPSTAPAGHRCPQCGGPLFPPPNLQGPVAEALRERLRTAPWARPGLGLPLIEDSEELPEPETSAEPDGGWDGSAPRKPLGGREARSPPDHDEDKYRRRPLAWLPPKLRCRARGVPRRPLLLLLCLGGAAAAALLLLLLAALGGGGADSDPALEPLNNPHVRVGP
ncbi:zinc finger protein-like 1 isoform X3 [Taeniopygia guttata]|uniref:zinc finger protein-like 1 isoform X3 n=1 Tax=Taeniopygia guttata TaxID=59729 RepID=UPI003BB99948